MFTNHIYLCIFFRVLCMKTYLDSVVERAKRQPAFWTIKTSLLPSLSKSVQYAFTCSVCNLKLLHQSQWFMFDNGFLLYFRQPSETWSPPNDNCTFYECQNVNDEFIITKNQTTCNGMDPEKCITVSII